MNQIPTLDKGGVDMLLYNKLNQAILTYVSDMCAKITYITII